MRRGVSTPRGACCEISGASKKLQEDEDERIARRDGDNSKRHAKLKLRARRFREEQEREEAEMEELRKQIEASQARADSKSTEAADEVTAKTLTRTKELEKMLSDSDI